MTEKTEHLTSPLEMFYHWEKETPNKPYLKWPQGDQWFQLTWSQSADQIRRMVTYLRELNLPKKSHIAILSKNCPHWIMADIAIWMSGHVSIPLYPNLQAETIEQILRHSEAKAIFVGKLDGWDQMKPGIPSNIEVISTPHLRHEPYPTWNDIIKKHAAYTESPVPPLDEWASIIYTSGTTGVPKGVIHNFHSFAYAGYVGTKTIDLSNKDRFFSYLPLSHVAERLLVETAGLYCGGEIYFAESLDTFTSNLQHAAPTVFLGVPRIWTKFQQGILKKMPPEKLERLLKWPLISTIIRKKIKKALGLNKTRFCVTGAAPTSKTTFEFYRSLGIELLEAYGMTENFAISHITLPGTAKPGYVGKPWEGVDVKLGEEQEVLVKSPCTMQGYFKEDEMTNEVITDGYLHTGDMGEISSEGDLKITGRVKDLFKTSKGKYVAPAPIEMKLCRSDFLEQVCVVGVGLPQPICLVNLSERCSKFSKEELKSCLSKLLHEVNESIDDHEKMKNLVIIPEEWTVENKILTPTMKIKRSVLESRYSSQLTNWYEETSVIIWS